MIPGVPFQGSLFAENFLRESIVGIHDWQAIDDTALDALEAGLREVFARFPTGRTPNESQTEDDLIWLVLTCLGWTATLRQQSLSARGREDVPDGLLFPDEAPKERANSLAEDWKRYGHGPAVVESKRWLLPLDRRSGRRGEETAPSTQMLRYLRRVDDLTTGKLRWGILTNGAHRRLYYAGRPRDFFASGFTEAQHRELMQRPDTAAFFQYLRGLGAPLRLPDLTGYTRSLGHAPFPIPSGAFQATPMRYRDAEIGGFFLGGKEGGFTNADEQVLVLFAQQAAAATARGAGAVLDPAEMLQFLRIIEEQADRMDGLVRDLLDAAASARARWRWRPSRRRWGCWRTGRGPRSRAPGGTPSPSTLRRTCPG